MADGLFAKSIQALMNKELDLDTDTLRVALIDTGTWTPNLATDDFLDDVTGGAIIGTAQTLTNVTITDGVFDADNVTFTAVTGASVEGLLIYHDTTVAATSRLIAFIDAATGLPVTPSGGDITIAWSSGANKIFKIG